ncbi:hypothetical protein [Halolamina salifodinae]|uniref:DUF8098 domain-containing protein n=1 Tax=Halolamina salifodinae TaxID=1202767 RepID=A0A8T4H1S6_9EURY|nr:hypothetical protein [Halolamina salifodinae]MBP1988303.1 hypothetical protein [Halolamina salifodinae]
MPTMSRYSLIQEGPILSKIEQGLEHAVTSRGLTWRDRGQSTKKQKYLDLIINHYTPEGEEPAVTRSWFLFGKSTPAAPSGHGAFENSRISDEFPVENLRQASKLEIADVVGSIEHPELNENNWTANTYDFLEEYYTHHAPPEYRDAYLANLELRRMLEEVQEEIQSQRVGQAMSEHDPGSDNGSAPLDYYEDLGQASSKLLMAVANKDDLDPARDLVREFSMLSIKFAKGISSIGRGDIEESHQDCAESMAELYTEYIWKYIASHMSMASAEGPKSDRLAEFAENNIDEIDKEIERQFEARRRLFKENGLIPDVSEYPVRDDDANRALTGHLRSVKGAE